MRILFYPPFKPLDHPNPSGDLVTAKGLVAYLEGKGHEVLPASRLRSRWIYWDPSQWPKVAEERKRILALCSDFKPDLWLTYHAYYKAPDLLGPAMSRELDIPYTIFQGIYSTKRQRRIRTLPGFYLNRHALRSAQHIFSNRKEDMVNLRRLAPSSRLSYVRPGIKTADFCFDAKAREELRSQWQVDDAPVVVSAAMFRADVKTQGLLWVIRACGELLTKGIPLTLVIAGDGKERKRIEQAARANLGDRFRLLGKAPREKLYQVYSAGDLFAFPGFRETLGMVFLEAQSCGLPVVACDNGGIPEVVVHGLTGLLTPLGDMDAYTGALEALLSNPEKRKAMGGKAAARVRAYHDLEKNYGAMEGVLQQVLRDYANAGS